MPTVNHFQGGTYTNVTVTSIVILKVLVAVVAFSLALLLRQAIRSSRDVPSSVRQPPSIGPGSVDWRAREGYYLPEKSRGVSSTPDFAVMSSNHDPKAVQSKTNGSSTGAILTDHAQWPQYGLDGIHGATRVTQEELQPLEQSTKIRPPPPLPMTLPESFTAGVAFEERRLSTAASTLDGHGPHELFEHPNPGLPTQSQPSSMNPDRRGLAIPRRKSYAKVLPVGPPEPIAVLEQDVPAASVTPRSFPSSSPILPLAPHHSFGTASINLQGEIISVMDHSGAGWKRHTRVYGGGVCLACMASGGEGGFYGDRVRPEERRER